MIRLKGYIIDNLMKWILYFLVILSALLTGLTVNGQDKEVDSLWKIHDLAKEDTVRIEVLIGIGDLVRNNMPDSSLACYEEALNEANKSLEIAGSKKNASLITNKLSLLKSISLKKIGNIQANMGSYEKACDYYSEALKIAERLANKNEIANINNNIGLVYLNQSNYDSAFVNFREFLKIKQETGDSSGIAKAFCNIGIVYFEQGRYDLALENYIASIKIAETQNYIDLEADLCANVGIVNKRLGNFNKALEYYLRSLEIHKERDNKYGLAADYGDIANIYSILADNDSALENLQASIKLYEELGDKNGLAIAYNNIGDCYLKTGEYKRTEGYFQKSLAIYEATGNKAGVANSYNSIATLNSIMADSIVNIDEETRIKYFNNSINYGIKGYNLALEIGSVYLQNNSASNLYKVNSKLGRYREALKYAEIVISTQDSLFSESKTKALTEMSVKYEAEKKQLQLEKMEKQKELDNKVIEAQEAKNKKQQAIIISVILGLVIVMIFSVILFRMFHQKRRANILLAEQNDRINRQNLLLSEQKKEITDSIKYANRIQTAILPGSDICKNVFGDHFILFRPRDIVSGDFYWGTRIKDWRIITVADCTGHGVPGAFMSLLGISFLNEIVRKKEIIIASEIVDLLREEVIEALQQKGVLGEQKDGMDISLCVLNTTNGEVQFCGANNNLLIVSSSKEVTEIHADKMPVAIYENMKPFTNHIIHLQKGDCLYLATDGFVDQFGGPSDKKFKLNQLKENLGNICDKPMNEQLEILDSIFGKWKGNKAQTDDVTIMGIRI